MPCSMTEAGLAAGDRVQWTGFGIFSLTCTVDDAGAVVNAVEFELDRSGIPCHNCFGTLGDGHLIAAIVDALNAPDDDGSPPRDPITEEVAADVLNATYGRILDSIRRREFFVIEEFAVFYVVSERIVSRPRNPRTLQRLPIPRAKKKVRATPLKKLKDLVQ